MDQYSGIITMKKTKLEHVFQKHGNLFGESEPLIFTEETCEREDFSHIPYDNIISKGAVKFLEKWPAHLYSTFLLGCCFISIIFTFILITILFSFSAERYRYRETRNAEQDSYNVYFMKHENRTWSRKELCYIETTAHKHPELNVYLINLVSENSQKNDSIPIRFTDMQNHNSFFNFLDLQEQKKNFAFPKDLSPETLLRNKIANYNSNVRNIDISTKEFFHGSILDNSYQKLNYELMEIAARANILWNYPGIALNPEMFNSVNNIDKYFCKKRGRTCKTNQDFIMKLQGDLQASAVSCHAFPEFLMKEILKNRLSDDHGLQNVINDFCPRTKNCPGVKIVNEASNYLSEISCPVTYPDGAFME